jgi:hypothetical protein
MASDVDASRLRSLIARLAAEGLPVMVGPEVGKYPTRTQVEAAALLVAVGGGGLPDPLPYPLSSFAADGQAVAAALATNGSSAGQQTLSATTTSASSPSLTSPSTPPAAAIPWYALGDWSGDATPAYDGLVGHLRALVDSGFVASDGPRLDEPAIEANRDAVAELQSLTALVADLGGVLSDDDERSREVRQTLAEIGSTYRAVKRAIVDFASAGLRIERDGGTAYSALAHGSLRQLIHNGRAHCTRIGIRYERVGGLRDGIVTRVPPATLVTMNETFARLATADGDLFARMERLGDALTRESGTVERLLLTGQEKLARQRIAQATEWLMELEEALDDALSAFQTIESALGYAEALAPEGGTTVTHQNITIYGDVVGSNVIAAGAIENSSIRVVGSDAREDIKRLLLDLHKAVATLTTQLPTEEAELVASDLETLSDETIAAKPRRQVWKRAADNLLAVAKRVAEVGNPIVDLVTKLAALLT